MLSCGPWKWMALKLSFGPLRLHLVRQLGKTAVLEAPDLGGALTYCRGTGLGSQRARLESLDVFWPRLRRSVAPMPVKLYILGQAFWAKAFHAIGITLMPFRHIPSLRTRAARVLGFGLAGANPAIRLGLLSGDMTSDPGYFQVVRVLTDFRRFLRKSRSLLDHWVNFMRNFSDVGCLARSANCLRSVTNLVGLRQLHHAVLTMTVVLGNCSRLVPLPLTPCWLMRGINDWHEKFSIGRTMKPSRSSLATKPS